MVQLFIIFFTLLFILVSLYQFKLGLTLYIWVKFFIPKSLSLIDIPGIPLITAERALIFALILVFIRYLILCPYKRKQLRSFPFTIPVIIFISLLFLTVLESTLDISTSANVWISMIVEHFMVMLMIWLAYDSTKDIKTVFNGLFLVYAFMTIYGLFTYVIGSNPYIEFLQSLATDSSRKLLYVYQNSRGGIEGRVQSIIPHAMAYGGFLAMIAPFVFTFLAENRSKLHNIFYASLIGLIIVNIFLTNSRSPLLFCFISLGFLVLAQKGSSTLNYVLTGLSIIVLLIPFVGLFSDYLNLITETFDIFLNKESSAGGSSISMRLDQLEAANVYFRERPIFGHGMGMVREIIINRLDRALLGAESIVFQEMVDTGAVGLLAYAILFSSFYIIISRMSSFHAPGFNRNLLKSSQYLVLGYLVFCLATGALNTESVYYILIALATKNHFINTDFSNYYIDRIIQV